MIVIISLISHVMLSATLTFFDGIKSKKIEINLEINFNWWNVYGGSQPLHPMLNKHRLRIGGQNCSWLLALPHLCQVCPIHHTQLYTSNHHGHHTQICLFVSFTEIFCWFHLFAQIAVSTSHTNSSILATRYLCEVTIKTIWELTEHTHSTHMVIHHHSSQLTAGHQQ